ncbi:MAG: DNA repair protein RadC [Bacteroidaceae bacterium]
MENEQKLKLKDWDENGRPREKMLKQGRRALSNAELLAILIGSGNTNETAVDLSKRILASCGNELVQLNNMTLSDLCFFKGIGEAKAITILAANELGRRRKRENSSIKTKIESPNDLFDEFYPVVNDLHTEEFWILLLNQSNIILDRKKISSGGITETSVDIRLIFREAIVHHATGIAVCHNHPSGNINPSRADNQITQQIKHAGELLNIHLIDHIIVANNHFYSYANEGNI